MRKMKLIIHETYQGKRKSEHVLARQTAYDPDEGKSELIRTEIGFSRPISADIALNSLTMRQHALRNSPDLAENRLC